MKKWYSKLSRNQKLWLFSGIFGMIFVVGMCFILSSNPGSAKETSGFSTSMSIREMAPKLGVTGKALARELKLSLDVPKQSPVKELGITDAQLQHVVQHLLSHRDSFPKYYLYLALTLWGLLFLVKTGRTNSSEKKEWYPRMPYNLTLVLSVCMAGFFLGKSPNPMEGAVKVFKSMVGLYPDPLVKVGAFIFFVILAAVGNKLICGWACPLGALQELIYSLPVLRRIKSKKISFLWSNTFRSVLFLVMLILLFGLAGNRKGTVIYHYINVFDLFDLDFGTLSISLTIGIILCASFFVYRPFCQFICPFGLISWVVERVSFYRVRIDTDRCTKCGICINICPLEAAKGMVAGKKFHADCFSCARCLNVCPVDAIKYAKPGKNSGSEARADSTQ